MTDSNISSREQALRIILNEEYDSASVIVYLVKHFPAIFVRAASQQDVTSIIKLHIMEGNMVTAIKTYRELTGLGLLESKLAVEAIRDEIKLEGL